MCHSVTLDSYQAREFQKYMNKENFFTNYEYHDEKLVMGIGEYQFGEFTISYKEEGEPIGDIPSYFRRMVISHPTDKSKIEELLKTVFTKIEGEQTIKVYNCSRHGFWTGRTNVSSQNIEHIFIPKETKNEIIHIIDAFILNKDRYTKFGRIHKLGFLLTGVPGSGKTSLVKSIALKYKRPLYTLSFGRGLSEEKVFDLINDMNENSILLLEDIDSVFTERKPEETTCISFSALINVLDGVLSNGNGTLVFMTANNPKQLDKALIRPGRVDKIIYFDYPKKSEIKEAFMHLTDGLHFESFYDRIKSYKINMSGIIDYLFKNEKEYIKNIDQLIEQTKLYTDLIFTEADSKLYL